MSASPWADLTGEIINQVIVTGATSQIGEFLLPMLVQQGYRVTALSRSPPPADLAKTVNWVKLDITVHEALRSLGHSATHLLHLAPLPYLPPIIKPLARPSLNRIIAFGSTSRFTKAESSNALEIFLARSLDDAEFATPEICEKLGIAWTIFRPTMIYGGSTGKDFVQIISSLIRTLKFFPIVGEASGMRQPVHAQDLATACLRTLTCPATYNHSYNLSGSEVLTFRDMVIRIFDGMGRRPRLMPLPLPVLISAIRVLQVMPRFRKFNSEMVRRMNEDLKFDYGEAARDFGFSPRAFLR